MLLLILKPYAIIQPQQCLESYIALESYMNLKQLDVLHLTITL